MRLKLLVMLVGCVALQGCNPVGLIAPVPHSGDPIQATVVDSDTDRPIAGAVMIAVWTDHTPVPNLSVGYSENGGLTTNVCYGIVYFGSAITDSQGQVQLPTWSHAGHCSNMTAQSPEIYIYAPGYSMLSLHNSSADDHRLENSDPPSEDVDGKTIRLKPLVHHFNRQKEDEQVRELKTYSDVIQNYLYDPYRKPVVCFWDSARPAMLVLMREERRLTNYMQWDRPGFFDYVITHPQDQPYGTKPFCGDQQAYVQALEVEAQSTQPEELRVMPVFPTLVSITSDMEFFTVMVDGVRVGSPTDIHNAGDRVELKLEPGEHLISSCFHKLEGTRTVVFMIKKTAMIPAGPNVVVSLNHADAPPIINSSRADLIQCLSQ